MKVLKLAVRVPGEVQNVPLILTARDLSVSSLSIAKEQVERLISGEAVTLEFESAAKIVRFRHQAAKLGAVFDDF